MCSTIIIEIPTSPNNFTSSFDAMRTSAQTVIPFLLKLKNNFSEIDIFQPTPI